jgi:hypothetical protein
MLYLQNGCYCSSLKVHPKNWEAANVSLKKDWYIYYRFCDPQFKSNPIYRKGKLVILKGMNHHHKSIVTRQQETRRLMAEEVKKLKENNFNPITGKSNESHFIYLIEPTTGFIKALVEIEKEIKGAPSTKRDLKSVSRFVTTAAKDLGIN